MQSTAKPCTSLAYIASSETCNLPDTADIVLINMFVLALIKDHLHFNSLAPGAFDYGLKLLNFKFITTINFLSIFCEIAVRWMPQHPLIISQHWIR